MNHQDDLKLNSDLESNYKAASNETPSLEMDQFIQHAAAQAITDEPSATTASATAQSNVVKGRFGWRKWQTPVSIAAAAVITFSFMNNLVDSQNSITEFEADSIIQSSDKVSANKPTAITPSISNTDSTPITNSRSRAMALDSIKSAANKKELASPPLVLEPTNSGQISTKVELKETKKTLEQRRLKQRRENHFTTAVLEESVEAELYQEEFLVGEIAEEGLIVLTAPLAKAQRIDDLNTISSDDWFNTIEQHLKNAELEKAKVALEKMLQAQPVESYTKQQIARLKEIKTTLRID